MPKFTIACPSCGSYAEARTGFFARKKIDCACGYTIDVRTDKLTVRECPHCGNMAVIDQSKGENVLCPVCKEPINTLVEQSRMEEFSCKQCGVRLRTSKAYSMMQLTQDSGVRKALEAFADDLRFSDPVSSEALEMIEADLMACVDEIQQAVTDDDSKAVSVLMQKAKAILSERNRLCRLYKS